MHDFHSLPLKTLPELCFVTAHGITVAQTYFPIAPKSFSFGEDYSDTELASHPVDGTLSLEKNAAKFPRTDIGKPVPLAFLVGRLAYVANFFFIRARRQLPSLVLSRHCDVFCKTLLISAPLPILYGHLELRLGFLPFFTFLFV